MTRFELSTIFAALALGACTPPETPSRLDTNDTMNSGFATAESYTPRPIAVRTQNDFMRFSTMGVPE